MYTNIKTFEDACKAIGVKSEQLPSVEGLPVDLAEYITNTYKLAVINKAINGDWTADFGNYRQDKWYPWFRVQEGYVSGSAGGFSFNVCYYGASHTCVGARLAYETEEQAEYAGRTFTDLYEKVFLIHKA